MRLRRHGIEDAVVVAEPPPARVDADEPVWQLADRRAADLIAARRALLDADAEKAQLQAHLGAVRDINMRLTAQAARHRRECDELREQLARENNIVDAARAYAKTYRAYLEDPWVPRDELLRLERAIVAAVDAEATP